MSAWAPVASRTKAHRRRRCALRSSGLSTRRPLLITNLTPQNLATAIQHYAPEGWRDSKLGNGNLGRYAYDQNGQMLEESNIAASIAQQQADPLVTQGLTLFNQNVSSIPGAASPIVQTLPLLTPEQQATINALLTTGIGTLSPISQSTQADLRYKLYPARKEIIWLDDLPIATIQSRKAGAPTEFFFIHSDHLNTPQRITDVAGMVAWESSALPFGEPWRDPQPALELSQAGVISQAAYAGNLALQTGSAISFNLRFPGQYRDQETNLHQNWMRDYDPGIGRYAQTDPIGLAGGINTYAYVGGNPISFIDPEGLQVVVPIPPMVPPPPGMPGGPVTITPNTPFFPTLPLPIPAIICFLNPALCAAAVMSIPGDTDTGGCAQRTAHKSRANCIAKTKLGFRLERFVALIFASSVLAGVGLSHAYKMEIAVPLKPIG